MIEKLPAMALNCSDYSYLSLLTIRTLLPELFYIDIPVLTNFNY